MSTKDYEDEQTRYVERLYNFLTPVVGDDRALRILAAAIDTTE